jgi:peptidoglycan/xylan/chitin deacetylase (PgdA/CDA1 family)
VVVVFRPLALMLRALVFSLAMSKAALFAAALAVACISPSSAQQPSAQQASPEAAPAQGASAPADAAQAAPGSASQDASGTADCPGHPDALGTSRVLALDPAEYPRVGRMQYPVSLPLNDKEVVLTFDDGPLPPYSNQILDILAAQCVKATYFLVGEMARAFPATVRRIYEEGHTIGTHSEDHPIRFGELPIEKMRQEIDWGISDVSAALGDHKYLAPFFRIPGLARSDLVETELAARGLIVFSSDTVADDWHHRIGAKGIIAAAMRRLEAYGKGILLLHDIHPTTVAALPGLLKELKDNGFHVVQLVPPALYLIAMANKPKVRIVATAFAAEATIRDDIDQGAPRWPVAVAGSAAENAALPIPDAAAFEPDAVPSEDVTEVQWPIEAAITIPIAKTKGGRRHKLAHSALKRKQRVAHNAKPEQRPERTHKDRHQRVRAGSESHHADDGVMSKVKAFTSLFTPAQAAH